MQKIHFLYLKKFKITESAQLGGVGGPGQSRALAVILHFCGMKKDNFLAFFYKVI